MIKKAAEKRLDKSYFNNSQIKAEENQLSAAQKAYERLKKAGKNDQAERIFMHIYNLKQDLESKNLKREEFDNHIKGLMAKNDKINSKLSKREENKTNNNAKQSPFQTQSFSNKTNNQHSLTVAKNGSRGSSNNTSTPKMLTGGEIRNGSSNGNGGSKDNIEKSKDIANSRKEAKQHTAMVVSSNPSTSSSTNHKPIIQPSSTASSPISTNSHNSFLSNHKKDIGLGAVGLVGAALVARKIAALRKQQQEHPDLRGKLQAIINKLKSKLHK